MPMAVQLIIVLLYSTLAQADPNVGEPRDVRLVYVIPHDGEYNQAVVDKMKEDIINVQRFYAQELERHGYGYRQFNIEMDTDGTPLVHILQAEDNGDFLITVTDAFLTIKNVYFILYDNDDYYFANDTPPSGTYQHSSTVGFSDDDLVYYGNFVYLGGYVLLPTHSGSHTLHHELGHVFNLSHNFLDNGLVMSYGNHRSRLSACYARILAMNPYFNNDISLEDTFVYSAPRPWMFDGIDITMPSTYIDTDKSIPITVEIDNPNGIYQVLLEVNNDKTKGSIFVDCQPGDGVSNTFNFEYSGTTNSTQAFGLNDSDKHLLLFQILDMKGNIYRTHMVIEKSLFAREDVNQDGIVNIFDIVIVANHISSGTYERLADVNNDGVINVLDLIRISQQFQNVNQ